MGPSPTTAANGPLGHPCWWNYVVSVCKTRGSTPLWTASSLKYMVRQQDHMTKLIENIEVDLVVHLIETMFDR